MARRTEVKARNTVEDGTWVELMDRKEGFQDIVRLLADFDEKSGRFKQFPDPETHYMRKAVAVAAPDKLRVFLQHLGGFVYYVVVEINSRGGHVCTSWVHEDGIRMDRDAHARSKKNPVHSILCLTDLFEESSAPPADLTGAASEYALAIMAEKITRDSEEDA